MPCSLPDMPVRFNWTRLQPGMCKGHVLPNLICSIFLTLNGHCTLRQPRDTMTHPPRLMGTFHWCGNANDTVCTRNHWEQFWTFCVQFYNPAVNVKGHYFPRDLCCFHQEHVLCALKECSKNNILYEHISDWDLIRLCCFENWSRGLSRKRCYKSAKPGDRWAMELSHGWRSDHSYAEIHLGLIYWNPLEETGPHHLLRGCCARSLEKSYHDFMRSACKTGLQH